MAERDDDIPRDLTHRQFDHGAAVEARRFQRLDPDGPLAPRDSMVTFADTKGLFSTPSAPGASRPGRGEPDPRPLWDAEDVLAHVPLLIAALRDVCPDGTILANGRKALAYGLVHALHRQVERLTKATDSRYRALQRATGSRLPNTPDADADLNAAIADYQNADARAKAFERIFSTAALAYRREYGEVWAPTKATITLRTAPTAGRTVTSTQVRAARRNLQAQQRRPAALAESTAKYDVPERVLAQSGTPDGPALYEQWRTDAQALFRRARAAGVHVSRIDGYPDVRRRARELAARYDLSSIDDGRIAAFLAGVENPTTPTEASVDPAGDSPSPAEPEPASRSWDPGQATAALNAIISVVEQDVLAEGTQLRDDLEPVLWSFTNTFHREAERVSREIDELEASPATRTADIAAHIDALAERLEAFEALRDYMASAFTQLAGKQWRSKLSAPDRLAKTIPGAPADPARAREQRRDSIVDPEDATGPLVVVTGHKTYQDLDTIYGKLNAAKAFYPDMTLVHGGAEQGPALIAQTWARNNGVDQAVLKPDWHRPEPGAPALSPQEKRRLDNNAINARNDRILALKPAVVMSFDAPGDPEYLADRAEKRGIPVRIYTDHSLPPKPARGRPEPAPERAPAPDSAAPPPWEQEPPAVQEYDAFVKDSQKHHVEAQAAGVHPLYHRGADDLYRRATHLRDKDYLPEANRAEIAAFCRRVETFTAARDRVTEVDDLLQNQAGKRFVHQIHVTPSADQHTPLLHRSETSEYPEWAAKTDELLPQAAAIAGDPETYRAHLDHAPELRDRLAQNTEVLTALRANDTAIAPADALLADIRDRSLALAEEALDEEISWIDHRDTPQLLKHAALLTSRSDLPPAGHEALADFRDQYDSTVEARRELHRLAGDLDSHLHTLSDLQVNSAEQRIPTTEHPKYSAWNAKVDELGREVGRIFSETDRYGDHLRADPALSARLKISYDTLATTRDACERTTRMLPPLRSYQPEPSVKQAPAVHRAPTRTPEPEPLPPQITEPAPAPDPGYTISPTL